MLSIVIRFASIKRAYSTLLRNTKKIPKKRRKKKKVGDCLTQRALFKWKPLVFLVLPIELMGKVHFLLIKVFPQTK